MKGFKRILCVLFVVLMGVTGVACGGPPPINEDFEDNDEEYTIKFYMPNNGMTGINKMADLSKVVAEANKITMREINAKLEIVTYAYSEYTTKMSGVIGANVKYDVCHTSPLVNHYALNVHREAFYPLDTLLEKYAPETKALFSDDLWDQTRVNGKIYGVMNNQILARAPGMVALQRDLFVEFIADKYPLRTMNDVWEEAPDTLQICEEYMEWLKDSGKGHGGKLQFANVGAIIQTLYKFDDMNSNIMTPGVVRISDAQNGDFTVIDQFNSPEFNELFELAKSWINKGYIPKNYNGRYDLYPDSTYKPGRAILTDEGFMRDTFQLGTFNYYTSSASLTMNAISRNSGNPARAMKFIELLSTDKDLHNLLQFGIKDLHYTVPDPENEPNRIEPVQNSRYDNINFGWGLGNEFNSFVHGEQIYDMWEQYDQINKTAVSCPLIGFVFESDPVKQKIKDCHSIYSQYVEGIFQGKYPNPDLALSDFRRDIADAGAADIIAEKQKQLDAWVASKV